MNINHQLTSSSMADRPYPVPDAGVKRPEPPARVLLAEDDPLLMEMLALTFDQAGYHVERALTVASLRTLLMQHSFDLVIVNWHLQRENGLHVFLQHNLQKGTPCLCMCDDEELSVRNLALAYGAADFMVKPLDEQELLARSRRLITLYSQRSQIQALHAVRFCFQGLTLDLQNGSLSSPTEKSIKLTSAEFKLLTQFVRHPYISLQREKLTEEVLGRPWRFGDRSLDVIVSRLNKKLSPYFEGRQAVRSERFVGYVFESQVDLFNDV
ncbi:two component transcriptional regulator, winged helix family [Magnetococcus marinus MC-1]|uniref:Two component transcriptional regulator, winged helix family n=1 Tax=Magnetococcus marinus (strain ATCC BAA-1437 / JCM 17883 / MC-1) TaxID=156889 RepID=A0LB44_MAGMM|nr:response regulator transcription factor [Magnetococcus marinus]ABK45187.1 two component transcriptional regulator, winged helix family [Magnetococcus marinus MC-1]